MLLYYSQMVVGEDYTGFEVPHMFLLNESRFCSIAFYCVLVSTTLWAVTPVGHHGGRFLITLRSLTCSSATFRVQNISWTTFVGVFFVTLKVPERATILRGILILTLTFAQREASILQRVIRGQVLKERNN